MYTSSNRKKTKEYLKIEKQFAEFEEKYAEFPKRKRYIPCAGAILQNTLIQGCDFPALEAAHKATNGGGFFLRRGPYNIKRSQLYLITIFFKNCFHEIFTFLGIGNLLVRGWQK